MKNVCPDCGGTGRMESLGYTSVLVEECSGCGGTGAEDTSRRVRFQVPVLVKDGDGFMRRVSP